MKLYIGSDHAGYDFKEKIISHFDTIEWCDMGCHSSESVDYPDYAHQVASNVVEEQVKGVLVCGSANGVAMSANKHAGVRAGIAWTPELAALTRQHNDANIICIPARFIEVNTAFEIIDTFLKTDFEGGRHQRRVDKIRG